jgi:hypothetical protein
LTLRYLLALWHRQNGCCYLTGLPMNLRPRHPLMVTVDRINPRRGYTRRNVALAARWANSAKGEYSADDFHLLVVASAPFAKRAIGGALLPLRRLGAGR